MQKRLILGLFLVIANLAHAQAPSGLWILTHVKALQPIYTMVEIDGEFELVDEEPQDSSYLYNSGLMTIDFQRNAVISHSWDGKESWNLSLEDENLFLFGQRDTLYGKMDQNKLIFQSTLDDRPTFYHFVPFEEPKFSTPDLLEKTWAISSENVLLKDLKITFTTDSTYQIQNGKSQESNIYFTHNLDKLIAFEYDFPPTTEKGGDQELGTVYLYKLRRNKIYGIFYPISDGLTEPEKFTLELKKSSN